LGVGLGIFGPIIDDAAAKGPIETLKQWQTIIAAMIALLAAFMAWKNTNRQIENASNLERQRQARKRAALRAVLPLALSSVADYAQKSAKFLRALHGLCIDETLPKDAKFAAPPPASSETISTLMELIEYSEGTISCCSVSAAAFRKGYNETGYVEGQDVMVEHHWLDGRYDRVPSLIADLVRRRVAVIATPARPLLFRQPKRRPQRSRSSSASAETRLRLVLSPALPGRAATPPGSLF